ncbi:hypothetical protein [Solibacillus sp.]
MSKRSGKVFVDTNMLFHADAYELGVIKYFIHKSILLLNVT